MENLKMSLIKMHKFYTFTYDTPLLKFCKLNKLAEKKGSNFHLKFVDNGAI